MQSGFHNSFLFYLFHQHRLPIFSGRIVLDSNAKGVTQKKELIQIVPADNFQIEEAEIVDADQGE